MLTPARSNSPPFEQKSFCMSITITAVREVLIVTGSGLASMAVSHTVLTRYGYRLVLCRRIVNSRQDDDLSLHPQVVMKSANVGVCAWMCEGNSESRYARWRLR